MAKTDETPTGDDTATDTTDANDVLAAQGVDDDNWHRTLDELVALDVRAREHGCTVAQILAIAAKNAFGIDLR